MNKYLKAALSNTVFFIFNTVFFLVITSIALRIMGEKFYGLWAILNAILLLSNVGTLGLGLVVNKFSSEAGENALPPDVIFSTGALLVLPMAIIVAGGIIVLRTWIAKQLNLSGGLAEQFQLALTFTAFSIFFQFFSLIPYGYLLGQLKNTLVRTIELGINISLWIGVVFLAFHFKNLAWMALWGLVIQGIGMVLFFSFASHSVHFYWKVYPEAIQKMLSFSGFTFLESLAVSIFQHFDKILVGFVLGPATAGVYTVATSIGLRIPMITGQVTEVLVPYTSLKESLGKNIEIYKTFRLVSQIMGILAGLIASMLILWMNKILSLWISVEYAEKYSLLFRIIVFAYLFLALVRSGHQTLVGAGKVKFTSMVYLGTSILMISGVFFFSQHFGLVGAGSANFFMIFLFAFNLRTYYFASPKKFPYKNVFFDNGFPLIITLVIFRLTFFSFANHMIYQLLISVALTLISILFVFKEKTVRKQIASWTKLIQNAQ